MADDTNGAAVAAARGWRVLDGLKQEPEAFIPLPGDDERSAQLARETLVRASSWAVGLPSGFSLDADIAAEAEADAAYERVRAEAENLRERLTTALQLIDDMSDHLRQDHALLLGVETRRSAIAEEPDRD